MAQASAARKASAQKASSALQFTIERGALLKALGHIQSVVERRNTIPILSNVKIEADKDEIRLTATDMDIAITETIAAEIEDAGALTVPAHTLYDIVRKLPEGTQIQISGDAEEGKIKIESGNCDFSLACLPVTDFPTLDKGEMPYRFSLAPAELVALIDKPRFAISTEETRYYLNGIYFHVTKSDEEPTLSTVATDGHRLAQVKFELPEGARGMPGVIVPRKTVAELRKLLEETGSEITVSLSETKICFECGNAVLLSKLIDGTFPDYEKVIPSDNDKEMELDAEAFTRAVDRVSTISSEKSRAIKLRLERGKLTLSASNEENASAKEELDVVYDDDTIEIAFNSRYLLEMMAGLEGNTAKFIFADGDSPALIRDAIDNRVLYVIMPMRV